jgi:hypothetical protein
MLNKPKLNQLGGSSGLIVKGYKMDLLLNLVHDFFPVTVCAYFTALDL